MVIKHPAPASGENLPEKAVPGCRCRTCNSCMRYAKAPFANAISADAIIRTRATHRLRRRPRSRNRRPSATPDQKRVHALRQQRPHAHEARHPGDCTGCMTAHRTQTTCASSSASCGVEPRRNKGARARRLPGLLEITTAPASASGWCAVFAQPVPGSSRWASAALAAASSVIAVWAHRAIL